MKKMFLLLSFIVFTVFISCYAEDPEPEIENFASVDSITIVNKSDITLTIESLEIFDSPYGGIRAYEYGDIKGGRWYDATYINKRIDEIAANYVLFPGQSKTIEFPYKYAEISELMISDKDCLGGYVSSGYKTSYREDEDMKRADLVKLNCTYGDNMYPFAWMNDRWSDDDFDPDAADNPLLSERYLCPYSSGSRLLEFRSYTDSKFKTVYCLVTNVQ